MHAEFESLFNFSQQYYFIWYELWENSENEKK